MLIAKGVFLSFSLSLMSAFAAENAAIVSPSHAETALAPEVLTNESILALAEAGFSDAFIAEKVMISNRTHFDTSVEGLTYLRRNAITEELVRFIMEHASHSVFTAAPASSLTLPAAPQPVMIQKTKKAAMPAYAGSVAPPSAVPYANAAVASVTNPIVAPAAPLLAMAPAAMPFMVQPGFYGGWSIGGRPLYNYAPLSYGMYGLAPYGYPVPAAPAAAVSQLSSAPAASWWR